MKNPAPVSRRLKAILILSPDGRIRIISQRARRWLPVDRRGQLRLPRGLKAWLARDSGEPFCWVVNGRQLIVSLIDCTRKGSAILLLEKFLVPPNVTLAEGIALHWLTWGKTNELIAGQMGLGISMVKKHLTRAFDKLGVETRLEAALALVLLNNS